MENTVFVKSYDKPEVDMDEILRYARIDNSSGQLDALIRECMQEALGKLVYKVCWREFSVRECDEFLDMGFLKTDSKALIRSLRNCSTVIVFAATVGIELDRLILKYSAISPTKALFMQAIGTERIESLCNTFCQDIMKEKCYIGKGVTHRFSPGYGDFPVEVQKDVFRVLEPSRKIGLTLNSSMLMSPTKSVTAILGITDEIQENTKNTACVECEKKDCKFRR